MAWNASQIQQHQPMLTQDYADLAPFSRETFNILSLTLRSGTSGVLSLFGVGSNAINIVIFYRQGILSHSSIVSLTALALADWMVCLFGTWTSVCNLIFYGKLNDPSTWTWNVRDFLISTGARPINYFMAMTSALTAFATIERCFSVVFPFRVKTVFTPKKSLVIVICLYLAYFVLHIDNFFEYLPKRKFIPRYNVTQLVFVGGHLILPDRMFAFARTGIKTSCIILVALCNMIIFWKITLSQRFRNKSTKTISENNSKAASTSSEFAKDTLQKNNNQSEDQSKQRSVAIKDQSKQSSIATKDQSKQSSMATMDQSKQSSVAIKDRSKQSSDTKEMKLLRMITAVSIVFFVCYVLDIPRFLVLSVALRRGVDYHPRWEGLAFNVISFLQTTNSSVNIFIYLKMSSAFRKEFQQCFSAKKTQGRKR